MIREILNYLRNIFRRDQSLAQTDFEWSREVNGNNSSAETDELFNSSSSLRKNFIFLAYFLVAIIFAIIWFKLWSLQIVQGQYNSMLAEENRIRTKMEAAPRGLIYDRNNVLLASNKPGFALIIYPGDLPDEEKERRQIFKTINSVVKISKKKWDNLVNQELYQLDPIILKENLTEKKSLILREKTANVKAVSVEDQIKRKYKTDLTLSHLLGYIGKVTQQDLENLDYQDLSMTDYVGKSGIEASYDQYLRGDKGQKRIEVDSLGRIKRVLAEKESRVGNSLILTIDYDLQKKMKDSLVNMLEQKNLDKGVAVASNPQTGEILGMVSLPGYDNNIFTSPEINQKYSQLLNDSSRPLFNRVISGLYPSGSVIKPVVAAAGLAEKVVNENTWIDCHGEIKVENIYNPDIIYRFKDWSTHGPTNVIKALAESCNVFFYHIGGGFDHIKGLGYQRLAEYFQKFGLGSQTGIDLPLEEDGLIPSPEWKEETKDEAWYKGDTYHMSIGQGDLLVTPIQVNSYLSTIANGGTHYKPHLVRQIIDQDGQLVKKIKPVIENKQVISKEVIDVVKRGMRAAVTDGTATPLNSLPVSSAGKTGTAQTPQGDGNEHSWFTAFAPYNNPKIAITVIVENGGEGYDSALPVAKEVLEYFFKI
jgi:penicillin-binding protein 2